MHYLKDYKDTSDFELVEMLKNGNSTAFEVLVNRHKRSMATTISAMIGKCTEVDDIGQETFIRFYQNISDFRGDSSVGTYLTRIAINLSLNELSRRKRHSFLSIFKNHEQTEEIEIIDNQDTQNEKEQKELVLFALKKLEIPIRSVVVLRMIDGYSVKETAQILDIPQGTVLSRLSRGLDKLKEILKDYTF